MGLRPPVSTSFKPGQSGNPTGRPKGIRDRRQLFNEQLMLTYIQNGDGKRVMDVIKTHALEGNMKAASLFCQYVFFKPESSITINDQRVEAQDDIAKFLTPEQIRAIAEITLQQPEKQAADIIKDSLTAEEIKELFSKSDKNESE